MSSNNGALIPAFAATTVQIDYSAELVEESKATIIKELETIPLIINEHSFMEGATPFAIALTGALDLNIPFDALYALKDEQEKMRATFFERLRLHLEAVAPDKVVSIPLIKGSKFASAMAMPSIVSQFIEIKAHMKSTANDKASKAVAELLREASTEERAALKGKAKRAAAPPKSTRVVKPKTQPKKSQSEPNSILRKSVQATLNSAASYAIPKKTIQQPAQEGELSVQETKEKEIPSESTQCGEV